MPSVVRLTVTVAGFAPGSPSSNFQEASAVAMKVAAELLLIWKVQVPVLPPLLIVGDPHVLFRIGVLGLTCGVIDSNVGVVPCGSAVVETVNVWVSPTSFTPFGVMLTLASTNRLTAWPEFGAVPFVDTVNCVPSMVTVAVA